VPTLTWCGPVSRNYFRLSSCPEPQEPRLFGGHGLVSAYHTHHNEKQGAETRPTHYFHHHESERFHIDYVFVPKDWELGSVEMGSFGEWGHLSDHVPVVVDVGVKHQ
jgi:endonuclease/exonuclease/phosphatase family metal-dependent hydrolase